MHDDRPALGSRALLSTAANLLRARCRGPAVPERSARRGEPLPCAYEPRCACTPLNHRNTTPPHSQASHPGARPVTLVDVPGHPRVRGAMERYADRAAGLVFVVDSVDFMPRKTEAAE